MNNTFFKKYIKYKSKYLELKNKIEMKGGAGFPLLITTGIDNFSVSGYSQLMKLQGIIKKKEGGDWFKISKHIKKYATTESYNKQGSSTLVVTPEEFKILRELAVSLKILYV